MTEEGIGGFSYVVTDEQIAEWMEVPVEEKLRWLEAVCRLTWDLLPPEVKEIRELLRRGAI
jgi:hypothetical protein